MHLPRASGVLLHPTSLPNGHGIGDFGQSAYDFVDFLVKAKQTYWQVLPLGPTGFGDSPYQCFSAFAGNTLLISPEGLLNENLITSRDLESRPTFRNDKVDYGGALKWKNTLLKKAYKRLYSGVNKDFLDDFKIFCKDFSSWLDDYALFRAIKVSQDQKPWCQWEKKLRLKDRGAVALARKALSEEIEAQKFYQFLFFRQWFSLKNYCHQNNVKIIGDVPIFVALDSSDVWAQKDQFKLNDDGSPRVVAGVPPDYFSKKGQLWGNPVYDWERMSDDNFRWWKDRIGASLSLFDVLRIDHFRGFVSTWEVPGEDETAEKGNWVNAMGYELFSSLSQEFEELPIFVEDLGDITQEVRELKSAFGFPGIKILQFAFGGDTNSAYLPHNYETNCFVYTGTHDNDTTIGWYKSRTRNEADSKSIKELQFCMEYLNSDGENINWDFIRAAFASVADTTIIPFQDLLGLDNTARMNIPATTSGNWRWRFRKNDLGGEVCRKLRKLTELYSR